MSDTPTTKPRMGLLKKLGIGAAALLACLVLAVLVFTQLEARWEARVRPLSIEELQELTARDTGRGTDDSEERTGTAAGQAGASTVPAGSPGNNSEPSDARNAAPLRLASRPTPDQLARVFRNPTGSAPGVVAVKAIVFALKVGFMTFYEIRGDDVRFGLSATERAASTSLVAGDFDSARAWLREGVRVEEREEWRRLHAGLLAWVEEDPEVAAALLEESCSGRCGDPGWGAGTWVAPVNALDLCIATGSEDLAERYYLRYRESWPKWMELRLGFGAANQFGAEREAWIRNYEARTGLK